MNDSGIVQQWRLIFEDRIKHELMLQQEQLEHYELTFAPLIYSCLMRRRVSIGKRRVLQSPMFKSSIGDNAPAWNRLQRMIESGGDINGYLSKSIRDWTSRDTLLYQCKISHFHLRKNSEGGIGREIVFAIVDEKNFYALRIADHHTLYDKNNLAELAETSWPGKFFKLKDAGSSSATVDRAMFKEFAHHPSTAGINYFEPAVLNDGHGSFKSLNNPQGSAIVGVELKDSVSVKVPLNALLDYWKELDSIESHVRLLRHHSRAAPLKFKPEPSRRAYVGWSEASSSSKSVPTSILRYREKGEVLCPLADKYF